jgi:hypothetical protein
MGRGMGLGVIDETAAARLGYVYAEIFRRAAAAENGSITRASRCRFFVRA